MVTTGIAKMVTQYPASKKPDKLLVDIPLLRRLQHIFSQRCTSDLSAARARLSVSHANTLSVYPTTLRKGLDVSKVGPCEAQALGVHTESSVAG